MSLQEFPHYVVQMTAPFSLLWHIPLGVTEAVNESIISVMHECV